ncbi:MAG TPA: hypothetical protein VMU30_02365 [Bacteroidota bacterium]|nr:hypothetical protein [Bacteroidota bacterium]
MKPTILVHRVVLLLATGTILTSSSWAQLFQARFVTSAYAWQQADTVGQSANHFYGFQSAQFSLAAERFSFHTNLQGFNDFSGPLKNEGILRVYDLYAKYAGIMNAVDVSVGRQSVFAGAGSGTIDGGMVTVRMPNYPIKLLGYYGALPVEDYKFKLIDNTKSNNMLGGQIVGSPAEFATVSLSYMRKEILPESYWAKRAYDSTLQLHDVEITPSSESEQYLSGDVNLEFHDAVSGYARYDYDVNQEKTSRIQFSTRIKITEPLSLTGEYLHREPRLSYNSIFWVFAYNTVDEYEVGAEYTLCKNWQVFGKYGEVSYGDDRSHQVTLGSNTKYVSASASWNAGYGGSLAALSANAGYPLWNNKLTPTVMVSYAQYRLSDADDLVNALSGGAGLVYRPVQALSFDGQVQYIQNKIYDDDVRFFLRCSYHLSERLNIF